MFDYFAQEIQSKAHMENAQADAENYRLVQRCKAGQPSRTGQVLATIGDVLVNVGTRLQEQRSTNEQGVVLETV
jgi:hypothetical protein